MIWILIIVAYNYGAASIEFNTLQDCQRARDALINEMQRGRDYYACVPKGATK